MGSNQLSKPDESLNLAHRVLESADAESPIAVLARGLIRHHSASVALQAALQQSLALEVRLVGLLTNSVAPPRESAQPDDLTRYPHLSA